MSSKELIINSFKRFDWKLYSALLLTGLLPTLYTTVRINYLGNLPGDWGVNIASQLVWINLIFSLFKKGDILYFLHSVPKMI